MEYGLLFKIFKDLFKIDAINYGKSKILTFAHDTDRGYLFRDKYYSPLIDTIEEDLRKMGFSCVSISRIVSTIKGDLSYGNVHSPEGRFARALVAKRIKALFSGNMYPFSNLEASIWNDILNETKAEKAIGILPSRELCSVCREKNIWVADVQHGVIADSHYWYGKKFREIDPVKYLPNAFLVWDPGSAEVLRKWTTAKNIDVTIIGNRWVERFKQEKINDEIVAYNKMHFEAKLLPKDNRKNILLSLSWGLEGIRNGILSDNLINVIKNTSSKYRWLLRLHPNQLKGFASSESKKFIKIFNAELKNHAEWEMPSFCPLPLLLKHSKIHISWNSSIAIEAAQFGIKSALLDPRLRNEIARDYFDYYKREGYINLINDEETIIKEWIENNIDSRLDEENDINKNSNYLKLLSFLTN